MEDFAGLAVSLAFSVGASLCGGWWTLRRWSQARHLLDTPTSKIRSAAQGYVELYGVLEELPEVQVHGPLTGKPCVWWRFRIEEYQSSDNKKRWRPVESGTSEAWLRLNDGTGECLIDPRGAEVRPVVREAWEGNLRHPRGPARTGFLGWLSSGKRYRYVEERLHVGQPLYAIGDFRTLGGGRQGLDLEAAQRAVIREWKGDFAGLLQRFDNDGNGHLDETEWNRVRLAAQLEAEDRHRQVSAQPAMNRMARPGESRPFILANAGEDEIARGLYWQAAAGAVLCLCGALATAWLLGIRHF
ncbi:GIDE domain-containing protein [Zestomonas carbonaria]|uniref:RING-type E3 ubiquitin transferase n=1 Tax=Zestomonas carbonaria TaxID=2762745 RepID=A0A7U7EPJ6_9GAMM|nr:GIDE domain-containing protein [Pseudomonas carbonaria]CAD5107825.1 hypothetical protein PSEWESI4_02102 [Pseudomonas carbonaria]